MLHDLAVFMLGVVIYRLVSGWWHDNHRVTLSKEPKRYGAVWERETSNPDPDKRPPAPPPPPPVQIIQRAPRHDKYSKKKGKKR